MGIAVLGPLVVDGEDGRLGPRDRVVLAALAHRPGDVVTADQLAEALWGDVPPSTWSKVVQGCVVRLRKVLGTEAIETSRLGYRLVVPAGDIDSTRFERLVRRARQLLSLAEPERAVYLLDEALALWRGRALTELEGWERGRTESARLDELRQDAEELRVDAALRAGYSLEVLTDAQALVAQAPLRERRWALLALAQYQVGRQAEALQTLRRVRRVLAEELGIDPGSELVALERAILRQDATLAVEAALPAPGASCPYPGLLPYDVAETESFFGRDADVAEGLKRLRLTGVLVVVGPSGCGKSSLVRAGLAAALEREGGARVVVVTPGTRPRDALSVGSTGRTPPTLVVDQCEEAVTLCSDPGEQAGFFQGLATYAEHGRLIVALRADRVGELSAHPSFARLVERGLYLLGAMGPDQLRSCIEGPAHQAGLLLEPGLVDLLLREVEGEAGALPLLAHALRETWLHREGRTLTVAGYQATGGIRGAVARSAEEVYARVGAERQPIIRDLMLRLVAPGVEGESIRSRMPRRLVADDAAHRQVIDLLVATRLVTTDDGVLELAHEALARAWPRLRQWLEDDTAGQRIMRHLSATADGWQTMGQPESELYRGVRLAQALDWRETADPELTEVEQAFLEASHARVGAEVREAQDQARREARAGRRTRRLAVGLAAALALTVAAAGVATGYQRQAEDRAGEAEAASTTSDANRLAALSKSVGALDLSLLLAAEALRTADTPATRDGLLSSLVLHRRATHVLPLDRRSYDAEMSDRGRTLFVSTQSEILAWDVGTFTPPRVVVAWDQPQALAVSPTDDLVALLTVGHDGEPRVGVFDGEGAERLLIQGDDIGGWPAALGFSSDGRRLRVGVIGDLPGGGHRTRVHVYELGSRERIRSFTVHESSAPDGWMGAAFADDGGTAVSWAIGGRWAARSIDLRRGTSAPIGDSGEPPGERWYLALPTGFALARPDGTVALYDHSGRLTQRLEVHQEDVNDIVVSPQRDWAVSADDAGRVVVWDIDPRTHLWSPRESLVGHSGSVKAVALDPRKDTVVTVSLDGTAISWDLSSGAGFGEAMSGLDDRWLSNRPETVIPGELVVAPARPEPTRRGGFGLGGAVVATFLDPRTGAVVDEVRVGDTVGWLAQGSSVAVSPDRTRVAVTYAAGTVVLDTRTREEVARIVLDDIAQFGERDPELVWCTAWSPDGSQLLLCADGRQFVADDGDLVVVDATSWTVERTRADIGGSAQTIELSPDDSQFAVGMTIPPVADAPPGTVQLLDADTLEVSSRLGMGPGDHAFDLSFSPDGSRLAVGTGTGHLFLFDVESGRRLHDPAKVHNDFVQQVEWLPDGKTVASTGSDGMVSLYDADRGLVRASMPASAEVETAYTFLLSVSQDTIATVSGDQPGRTYQLSPSKWLQYACLVAGRDLTQDEWASYLPGRDYERTCSGHA